MECEKEIDRRVTEPPAFVALGLGVQAPRGSQ